MSKSSASLPDTWSRIMIPWVEPVIDRGRWPIKRIQNESVTVRTGIIVDGHDEIAAELAYRHVSSDTVHTVRLEPVGNDTYTASFTPTQLGDYTYQVRAWLDRFGTWQDQFERRVTGGSPQEEIDSELHDGAALLRRTANATADDHVAERLRTAAAAFEAGDIDRALNPDLLAVVRAHAPRDMEARSPAHELVVDPRLAREAAWYEFFPRSASPTEAHATFDDAAKLLPRIREMGFDIVYLPPIHPIGETNRKGKDNAPTAEPGDVGSPWAIGGFLEDGSRGGHKSVHPELGGMAAFERFVDAANAVDLEVALDVAFQCSPDHPYIEEHPEWFYQRPDGSIRYAENPPKKYEDVHPLNFECDDWQALWMELKSVFEFWIERGVTIFRVDNPHTKVMPFWTWCLRELRKETPELIVLAEAFARPNTMYSLAKLGYSNSYTYFTWRNTKHELENYARELFHTEKTEYYRPNFWPNTPDILHDELAHGGRPKHKSRFVLAATLSPVYGVYGPPYEHVDNRQHPDREEYAYNEKYEIRTWNWNDPTSLQPFMKRVNRARQHNPALRQMRNITFLETRNDRLIAYVKWTDDNAILVVVSLDPYHEQYGELVASPEQLHIAPTHRFTVHDVLNEAAYEWSGHEHFLHLTPEQPAHIFRIESSSHP